MSYSDQQKMDIGIELFFCVGSWQHKLLSSFLDKQSWNNVQMDDMAPSAKFLVVMVTENMLWPLI